MSRRPTEDQLVQLYHEKGCYALAWYAWRNSLRALPILGVYSLSTIWKEGTVQQAYSVCRIPLLLAQWWEFPESIDPPHTAASSDATVHAVIYSIRAAARVTDSVDDITSAISEADSSAFSETFHRFATDNDTAFAISEASKAADESSFAVKNNAAKAAAGVAAEAANKVVFANTFYIDAGSASDDAAAADYLLLRDSKKLDGQFWVNQPLWISKKKEPGGFRQACEIFTQCLTDLGLGFLAEDINVLWKNQDLKPHVRNYRNDYSEVELNSADTLRGLIMGEEEANKIHAVRLLLLGPGGAGKSSLADRLQGRHVEAIKRMTVGVDYQQHQPLNLRETFPNYGLDRKQLDLFMWDFGGQTIFHGLHRAFLHENCVYVLVVDSRHEQAPDEWLHQIKHLAGIHAKVLLVTNQYEECKTPQNQARLLREFPGLLSSESFFYFSCLDCVSNKEVDFQKFVTQLVQNSLDAQKMVLKETLDVQKALQKRYQDKEDVFLEIEDLENVVEETTCKTNMAEEMADKLQQLGFLVKVDHRQSSYCLKPEWAIDHAYELLYSEPLRASNGLLTFKSLSVCFEKKLKNRHMEHLINFLEERSLCHKLSSTDEYFFPDSAKADEPEWASKVLKDKNALILRFDMSYLPLGFHARLVHKLFAANTNAGIQSPDDIWRQGFVMRKESSQAVVQYQLRKNVIEMVLLGPLKDFSALLNVFFINLKAVVASNKGSQLQKIHPSVVLNQQSFSVHSSEALIKMLQQIENYDELFKEVTKMAGKKYNVNVGNVGDNSQVTIDAEDFMIKNQSDNQAVEVDTNQRQQITEIINELFKDVPALSEDQFKALVHTKTALEKETPENNNLLSRVWAGLSGVTDFGNNAIGVGQFVVKHQAKTAAVIADAFKMFSSELAESGVL